MRLRLAETTGLRDELLGQQSRAQADAAALEARLRVSCKELVAGLMAQLQVHHVQQLAECRQLSATRAATVEGELKAAFERLMAEAAAREQARNDKLDKARQKKAVEAEHEAMLAQAAATCITQYTYSVIRYICISRGARAVRYMHLKPCTRYMHDIFF